MTKLLQFFICCTGRQLANHQHRRDASEGKTSFDKSPACLNPGNLYNFRTGEPCMAHHIKTPSATRTASPAAH